MVSTCESHCGASRRGNSSRIGIKPPADISSRGNTLYLLASSCTEFSIMEFGCLFEMIVHKNISHSGRDFRLLRQIFVQTRDVGFRT